MPYVISRIGADTADALQIHDDQLGATVTRWDFRGRRVVAAAAVPTVTPGAGAGTGATATIAGDDSACRVTVTCGSTALASGVLATISLSAAFANAPFVALGRRDAGSAALALFATTTASTIAIQSATSPTASAVYSFDVLLVGA
jgi:hypothetical protein